MSTTQKKKLIAQGLLSTAGIAGFLLMINSIGAAESDYITIQLSLNVRACVTGLAIMCMAIHLYKSFFNNREE